MKLLTPDEYADAYEFWTEQTTRKHAAEVQQQIDPHVTWVTAEQHRRDALSRYRDTPQQQAHRLHQLNADADAIGDVRTSRKKTAA